ncbi:MAG: P-II family nitrogen regulator [Sedimentisphaerales bacterium]|jgi:nitrogen regulatory protein P-II 1
MNKIEAIVRPGKVADICAVLEKVDYPGLMITEIEGHGKQKGLQQQVRGKTYKVGLMTKARIEVVVKDSDTDKIVKAIRETAFTGKAGDGKIFISPVNDAVRIRTGERGEAAIK